MFVVVPEVVPPRLSPPPVGVPLLSSGTACVVSVAPVVEVLPGPVLTDEDAAAPGEASPQAVSSANRTAVARGMPANMTRGPAGKGRTDQPGTIGTQQPVWQ